MIDLEEFNAAFFDGSFDEAAVYTPSGGQAKSIQVIFDNEYQAAQLAGDVSGESSAPQVTCRSSDVADATHGATVLLRGVTYKVTEVRPEGTGLTVLILSKD